MAAPSDLAAAAAAVRRRVAELERLNAELERLNAETRLYVESGEALPPELLARNQTFAAALGRPENIATAFWPCRN